MSDHYAHAAYGAAHLKKMPSRSTEAEALMTAARLLAEANIQDPQSLAKALQFNHKLWCILEADVKNLTNPLAADIKTKMITLSRFMDAETKSILRNPNRKKLQQMSEINRTISSGLL